MATTIKAKKVKKRVYPKAGTVTKVKPELRVERSKAFYFVYSGKKRIFVGNHKSMKDKYPELI